MYRTERQRTNISKRCVMVVVSSVVPTDCHVKFAVIIINSARIPFVSNWIVCCWLESSVSLWMVATMVTMLPEHVYANRSAVAQRVPRCVSYRRQGTRR